MVLDALDDGTVKFGIGGCAVTNLRVKCESTGYFEPGSRLQRTEGPISAPMISSSAGGLGDALWTAEFSSDSRSALSRL